MRKIVQIANVWLPADYCQDVYATDIFFALDNEGAVWKGNIDWGDPVWRRLDVIPQQRRVIQISVSVAPRDGQRLGSVFMYRVFALCDDGSVWLKPIMLLFYKQHPWTRIVDIPRRRIVQISSDWAVYQADAEGISIAPLDDSVDRLCALCSDGTIWLYHPYQCWRGVDEPDESYWDRLPDLPPTHDVVAGSGSMIRLGPLACMSHDHDRAEEARHGDDRDLSHGCSTCHATRRPDRTRTRPATLRPIIAR